MFKFVETICCVRLSDSTYIICYCRLTVKGSRSFRPIIFAGTKWTPGHADIRGNCIADELAKEAAEEAKAFPEDSQILTGADFKKFARVSCCIKWQRSWDASDTGRHLYEYKPKVCLKTPKYMFIPFIEEKR